MRVVRRSAGLYIYSFLSAESGNRPVRKAYYDENSFRITQPDCGCKAQSRDAMLTALGKAAGAFQQSLDCSAARLTQLFLVARNGFIEQNHRGTVNQGP
jgi:hypothetical protein